MKKDLNGLSQRSTGGSPRRRFEPAVSEGRFAGAEQRLRDFLIFRFGGPPRYIERRGHPRLRMRMLLLPSIRAARDHWLQAMEAAMEESMLPEEVKSVLSAYFESTAAAMMNTSDNVPPYRRIQWVDGQTPGRPRVQGSGTNSVRTNAPESEIRIVVV